MKIHVVLLIKQYLRTKIQKGETLAPIRDFHTPKMCGGVNCNNYKRSHIYKKGETPILRLLGYDSIDHVSLRAICYPKTQ